MNVDWMLILLAVTWFFAGAATSRVLILNRDEDDLPPLLFVLICQVVWPVLWAMAIACAVLRTLYWFLTRK